MAITVTKRVNIVDGSYRQINAKLTLGTSSEDWVTGLKLVRAWAIDGGSAALTAITVSGGTITIASAAGATAVSATAWGY